MLTDPKKFEASMTVVRESTVRIGGVAANEIQDWQFAEAELGDAERGWEDAERKRRGDAERGPLVRERWVERYSRLTEV